MLCFLYLCAIFISIYSLLLSFIANVCFSKYSSVVILLLSVCQSPPSFCSLPSCISYSSRIDISDHELHLFIAKKHNHMLLKILLLGEHKYFYWPLLRVHSIINMRWLYATVLMCVISYCCPFPSQFYFPLYLSIPSSFAYGNLPLLSLRP